MDTAVAMERANETETKVTLQDVENNDDASLLAAKKSLKSITKFADTLKTSLKAAWEGTKGCANIVCGLHASCTETTDGGECVCDEGYVGDGSDCHAPESYLPKKMLQEGAAGMITQVAEMSVTLFMGTKVAVVWRDVTNKNIGRIMIGRAEPGTVAWAPPERFSMRGTKAFQPQVVGWASNRLAVTYRDDPKEGACWMRGAEVGVSKVRGADLHLMWGDGTMFCRDQAHQVALLPLQKNRAISFFLDKVASTPTSDGYSFGNSMLAQIGGKGAVSILDYFRFSDVAAVRIQATLVTPTSFVVACRRPKAVEEMDTSEVTRQEASAIFGEMVDDDVAYDPKTLTIEPERSQVWARGISLIAPYTLAYAYQMGEKRRTKMAIIKVDPETHRMKVVSGPVILSKGFSPYVNMVNYPYAPSDPHTFVYYEKKGISKINVCRFDTRSGHQSMHVAPPKISHCEDFTWMRHPVTSVSGISLGGGRLLFAFANEKGVPFYQLVGTSKK